MPAVPLRLRLPNPAPSLLGRAAELGHLGGVLAAGRVAVLAGPIGVGKLAIALAFIHGSHAEAVPRALLLRATDATTFAEEVLAAAGEPPPRGADPEALLAAALDAAAAADAWVVIDDAGGLPASLLESVARYARGGRWIFLTETPPTEALLDAAVAVPPLDAAVLDELATRWHPRLAAGLRALAVAAAAGSPGRLRAQLATCLAQGDGALTATTDDEAELLAVLGATSQPLTRRALAALVPAATAPRLDRLVGRALLVARGDALTLGGHARPLLELAPLPTARRDALIATLGEIDELAAHAEAIRLALMPPISHHASRLLDRHGAAMFEAGFATHLAPLVLASSEVQLARWRVRAAVELGIGGELIDQPPRAADDRADDRMVRAEGLMRANQLPAAIELVRGLDDPAAHLLTARALATLGDLDEALAALARLRAIVDVPTRLTVRAMALGARLEALAGRASGAHAALAALEAMLPACPPELARDTLAAIASTYHDLGALDQAEAALDAKARLRGSAGLDLFAARRIALVRAAILVDRGALDAAGEQLRTLDAAAGPDSLHRPFIAVLLTQLALARGDVAAAAAALARLAPDAYQERYVGSWAIALQARLEAYAGGAVAPAGPAPVDARGLWPSLARTHRARNALRQGEGLAPALAEPEAEDCPLEGWLAARALRWEWALIGGDGATALALATEAARRCATAGMRVWQAEATAARCDAALVAGDAEALTEALASLEALAAELASPRFAAEAAGARALAAGARPERLEPLAAGMRGPAQRRARYLLGATDAADALDRAVVAALGRPPARQVRDGAATWPGWGIDRTRRTAWLPSGATVELATRPQLWRLLEVLSAQPDGIARATLAHRVWSTPPRPPAPVKLLHNLVHKLRRLLDVAGLPPRIATTADGYRLADDLPIRIVE